jgi:hypothetical protein
MGEIPPPLFKNKHGGIMPSEEKAFQIFLMLTEAYTKKALQSPAVSLKPNSVELFAKEAIEQAKIFEKVYQEELDDYLGLARLKK